MPKAYHPPYPFAVLSRAAIIQPLHLITMGFPLFPLTIPAHLRLPPEILDLPAHQNLEQKEHPARTEDGVNLCVIPNDAMLPRGWRVAI